MSVNQNYQTLLSFSKGHADSLQAMETLGIESEENLFLLMAQARLPMPRLPESDTQEMVDQLNDLLQ